MNRAVTTWAVRVAAAVVGLAGAAAAVFGLALVAEDRSTTGEMFDGLGTFIGLVVCGGGAILIALALLVVWLEPRRPLEASLTVCGLGVLLAAAGWVAVTGVGVMVSAPMVLGGVFIGGLGFGAALGAHRVRVDSPGGNSW